MVFDLDGLCFGERLYAQGRWWLRIKRITKDWYFVCDKETILPAPALLIHQSEADRKYQNILFRKIG